MADAKRRTNTTRPREASPPSPWAARRKRRHDHDLKREAVVRAAAQAFNARGYHNTSLDDIAAALGVTKPTVYYYVASKEQLLLECFRAGLQGIRDALSEAEHSGRSGRERLNAVVRGYAGAIASEYGWCMVRAHEHDLGPGMGAEVKALKSEIDQGLRRLLRAGIDDGSIAPCDARITAFALAGALNGIAHWYRENQPMTAAQVADLFVAFFEQGLLPRDLAPQNAPALHSSAATPPGRVPSTGRRTRVSP
jgi:AcrR family transcriptional regulator